MRFPTMWYVWPAKPQISLRIRAVWSEPLLVTCIYCECQATDWTSFGVSKLKRSLHRLVWIYTCQNATLLEITSHGSYLHNTNKPVQQHIGSTALNFGLSVHHLQYFMFARVCSLIWDLAAGRWLEWAHFQRLHQVGRDQLASGYRNQSREHRGSVVECLTWDWGAPGWSLTDVTVLCPWAIHIYPCLVWTRPNITEKLLTGM